MKKIIQLTSVHSQGSKVWTQPILIGIDHIIKCEMNGIDNWSNGLAKTEVSSRAAMVTTTYVKETISEIFNLINE